MSQLWQILTARPLLSLAVVLVLLLLLAWLLYRVIRRGETRGAVAPADLEACGETPAEIIAFTSDPLRGEVRRSFARAEQGLRRMLPGRLRRYARPWVLAVGPADGGKTTLLSRSGMALPYGGPVPDSPGINWWAFDGGIVLDVAGRSCIESDACASDDEEWRGLLRQIRKSRRRRPIDAVVLTLPVSELLPEGGKGDQHLARAASRARHLHHKLVEAQRILRMRFPVYLMVSRCDRLPGFAALREALDAGERQQIVGWSNPGPPHGRYAAGLVERAFEEIEAQLEEHQLELLAGGGAVPGGDELVGLPERLRALAEPLRIYANHLFLPKADGEEPLFRGLYFCGGAGSVAEPATAPLPEGGARPPGEVVFVGDLLQQKVFPEAGLAGPTARASRRARRRAVLVGLLIAAVLAWGAAGLLVGQKRLAERLGPAAGARDAALAELLDRYGESAQPRPSPSPETSRDLLMRASKVESFRVWSPLLPASWFGGLQGEVDRSMDLAFTEVVMPTLLAALEKRADRLLAQPLPDFDYRRVSIEPIEDYELFKRLDSYVGKVAALEGRVERYQAFTAEGSGRRPSLRAFNDLCVELLGEELLPRTKGAERYLERRLRRLEARPFDYGVHYRWTRQVILDRTDQLYRALFVHHRLLQDLEAVSHDLVALGPLKWSTEADPRTVSNLDRGFAKVQEDLEEPDLAWVLADELAMPPRFDEMRLQVHESRFLGPELGPEVSEEMLRRARRWFKRLKNALEVLGTGYGGPMLELRDGKFVLTRRTGELKDALDLIAGQLFMQAQAEGDGELVAAIPRGKMLLWRKQPLEEALAVYESYEGFDEKEREFKDQHKLDQLPPPLAQSLPQIASSAAGSNVIKLVKNAISYEPLPADLSLEAAVEMQVRNLQEVEPVHTKLLEALDELDRDPDKAVLEAILQRYQTFILEQLDALLGQDLYQPRFAAWKGKGSPVVPGFVTTTADDVPKYLDAQREVVERLVALARPVLEAYGAAGHSRLRQKAVARQWLGIVDDIDAYGSQEAGNPLARLEGFVATSLPKVDLYSCFAPLPPEDGSGNGDDGDDAKGGDDGDDAKDGNGAPAQPVRGCPKERAAPEPTALPQGDFFLDRLAALRRGLRRRCVELADEVGFDRYRDLAHGFNDLLAGLFPFAPPGAAEGADPADIKALLNDEFCRTRTLIRNLPRDDKRWDRQGGWHFSGERTEEAQEFVESMEKVVAFFRSYLPEDAELEVPTFDVEVEFRTLRSNERGANQIIRWELEVGEEQRVDLLASLKAARTPPEEEDTPPVRWAYGLASVLSLAWAQESPFAPLVVEPSRKAQIDGRQVTFTYREPWSLLRMVAELEADAAELPALTDEPRPEILGIDVRTASSDQPHPVGLAKLYLTLSLFVPGKDEPLVYPAFPRSAPVWLHPWPAEPPSVSP